MKHISNQVGSIRQLTTEQDSNQAVDFNLSKEFKPFIKICDEHGSFQQNHIVNGVECWLPDCPACIRDREIRMIKEFMGRALIPERFLLKSFENYNAKTEKQKKAKVISIKYASEFESKKKIGTSMIFCGVSGTGKTHLACSIANEIMKNGHSAIFSTVTEMIRTIRKSWRDQSLDEIELIEKFANPDLLILDEIGLNRGSEDEKRTIFDVLNKRYEKMKPCIVISNLDLDGIEEYLGPRVFDRLREGGGQCVVFDWESYRRTN